MQVLQNILGSPVFTNTTKLILRSSLFWGRLSWTTSLAMSLQLKLSCQKVFIQLFGDIFLNWNSSCPQNFMFLRKFQNSCLSILNLLMQFMVRSVKSWLKSCRTTPLLLGCVWTQMNSKITSSKNRTFKSALMKNNVLNLSSKLLKENLKNFKINILKTKTSPSKWQRPSILKKLKLKEFATAVGTAVEKSCEVVGSEFILNPLALVMTCPKICTKAGGQIW